MLPVERRLRVARHAKGALVVVGAVGRVPTPLDDVAATLKHHPAEDLRGLADVALHSGKSANQASNH